MSPLFTQYEADDVKYLISEYPLAWVISPNIPHGQNSLLPLVGKYDNDGTLVALIGHMAKSNPLHQALKANPNAQILFQGPQGYISPNHAGRRNWGPTWNYASIQIEAQIILSDKATELALETLIEPCEQGQDSPWQSLELEGRYPGLLNVIIGFEAKVIHMKPIFKLGQDETETIFDNIMKTHPNAPLRKWMQRVRRKNIHND